MCARCVSDVLDIHVLAVVRWAGQPENTKGPTAGYRLLIITVSGVLYPTCKLIVNWPFL